MGFKQAKTAVIQSLRDMAYGHEPRRDINEKNLLHTGVVAPEDVIQMVMHCTGRDYSTGPHDMDRTIEVHRLKPKGKFDGWYIKFYFVPDGTMFISIHQ